MILPLHIRPDALGLKWGMSKADCLELLHVPLLKESPWYVHVRLPIYDGSYEVGLEFDQHKNLRRIEVHLYISRSFWDDYTAEEMETIEAEYLDHYNHLKEYWVSVLGPPDFSGPWGTEGYPDDQGAVHITYWDHPEGRMQIEFDHPDKEYPMFVTAVCYLPQSVI
jgi:hypothetical protein